LGQIAFVNCSVVDCVGTRPIPSATVLVEDSRITWIRTGDNPGVPEGAALVDLAGGYLMPGLWDCHCHPGLLIPDNQNYQAFETEAEATLRAQRNLLGAFQTGITSARVVGEVGFIDVALREAFAGITPTGEWHDADTATPLHGPRMFVAGRELRVTGGHGSYRRVTSLVPGALEVDGPDEVRKAVRYVIKMGVDWVKLMVTGGVAGMRESMDELQMTYEEIEAACDTAHSKGLRVSGHVGGAAAAKLAIRAGLDCVEHGYLLDQEAVDLMAGRGVFYVPTMTITQDLERKRLNRAPEHRIKRVVEAAQAHLNSFEMAVRAGVKIANGTDANPMRETSVKEVYWLAHSGMTNLQALQAATVNAAALCGVADQLGTVEAGKIADLIVVGANPLEDVTNLRDLRMVVKEGRIAVDRRGGAMSATPSEPAYFAITTRGLC
jgi:imidazolonepropionase-like amidohydrolase